MSERVFALLVHSRREPVNALAYLLEARGISIRHASTCAEAMLALGGSAPPPLVFCDAILQDGVWSDVVSLARRAAKPVNVIVVSNLVDISLYLRTIDGGAFDFVTPPFEASDVDYITRSALHDAHVRRVDMIQRNASNNEASCELRLVPTPA